jgi:hypothetical protein
VKPKHGEPRTDKELIQPTESIASAGGVKDQGKAASANKLAEIEGCTLHSTSREETRQLLHSQLEEAREGFPPLLDEVCALLRQSNPLTCLSIVSYLSTMGVLSRSGERSRIHEGPGQPGAELLQAIVVSIPTGELVLTEPGPDTIQRLLDVLPDLQRFFWTKSLPSPDSADWDPFSGLQTFLRLHAQGVRNWGFFDQVVNTLRDLLVPIDPDFDRAIGFPATTMINLFEHLVRQSERRATEHRQLLVAPLSEPTPELMVETYYRAHGWSNPQALSKELRSRGFGLEETKQFLVAHHLLKLPGLHLFQIEKAAEAIGAPRSTVERIAIRLGLGMGSLTARHPESLFLDNPVWTRPLVNVSGTQIFAPVPGTFFSHSFRILNDLVSCDRSLKTKYHRRRSEYLQSTTSALLAQHFPGCSMVENYQWSEGDRQYETDLLVQIDSHLLIVEDKSGRVTDPSLRGAPDRVRRDVQEVILEPSEQSLRFAHRIRDAIRFPDRRTSLLPGLTLDLDRVKVILRLSITLQDFATIQSRPVLLKQSGLIPADHPLATCMQVTELETVLDILESQYRKLHYLGRRCELGQSIPYFGDELELLGLYLRTGFSEADRFAGRFLGLQGMSSEIDRYREARADGIAAEKPQPTIHPWWKAVCDAAELRQNHRWSEATGILLAFSPKEQAGSEEAFQTVIREVRRKRSCSETQCAAVFSPTDGRREAVCLFAYRDLDRPRKRTIVENLLRQVLDSPEVNRCVVIGCNVDRDDRPYSTILVAERGDMVPRSGVVDLIIH